MKRTIFFLMIMSLLIVTLSGCNVTTNTIDSDGITRITSEEENVLLNISSEQNMMTPDELLKNLPQVWQDVVVLANGESYVCNAAVEGGDLTNYVVFELDEKKIDIEMLLRIMMGERKEQAVEVDDVSAEGQKYWAIVDNTSGRNLEELHYYIYEGSVADLFDYQRDVLIYDDQSQEIKIDESLATVSDDDAIRVTADALAKMGFAGMSILEGYNYQTEVTFYLLPQFTNLPVVADRNNAQAIRIKATVCDDGIVELTGNGMFREIVNTTEVSKLMEPNGVFSLAKAHLQTVAPPNLPPISDVSLRHRYVYDELQGTISTTLVWYFEIPPLTIQDDFGVGVYNYSFAVDAISGVVYGGF